mmetsp:Transcript_6645/g.11324  ORF Transcript_6645/g.11324 Transcript_6645/m.11324 type:complete len:231 (+) Transcript_6645:564-1256(+)
MVLRVLCVCQILLRKDPVVLQDCLGHCILVGRPLPGRRIPAVVEGENDGCVALPASPQSFLADFFHEQAPTPCGLVPMTGPAFKVHVADFSVIDFSLCGISKLSRETGSHQQSFFHCQTIPEDVIAGNLFPEIARVRGPVMHHILHIAEYDPTLLFGDIVGPEIIFDQLINGCILSLFPHHVGILNECNRLQSWSIILWTAPITSEDISVRQLELRLNNDFNPVRRRRRL